MSDLLTTREVSELLAVDRTTIYRMLNDGRLAGVKVGERWRFPREEVEVLMGAKPAPAATEIPREVIPVEAIQAVQDVCAEMVEVGAVTTDINGVPLTEMSNSCRFCNLVQSTESGAQACLNSWRKLARQSDQFPRFMTCHAGLQYARAHIHIGQEPQAMIVAGQFYTIPPDPVRNEEMLRDLAEQHDLDPEALLAAAADLPVLDDRKRKEISTWLQRVARTFASLAEERASLLNRLHRIAEMSAIDDL
ncbi:MAG: PocR ligand-binding domain-containing protein [Chloroflexota bacterium]